MPRLCKDVASAAEVVRAGGILAYPTEAVFGLGCNPADSAALTRLLALKRRPEDKGLILIAAEFDQLAGWLGELPPGALERCLASWPGPDTWVVPARPGIPPLLSGGRPTLAVRVTAHPLAAALCRACGHALVSTSANTSGQPPIVSAAELARAFGDGLDAILDGALGGLDRPTRIRDALTGEVLRR